MASPAMVLTSAQNPSLSVWDSFTSWLGAGALAEQQMQNLALPQAFTDQGGGSAAQSVDAVQQELALTNNTTLDAVVNDIDLGLSKAWTGLKDAGLIVLAIVLIVLAAYVWRAFR